MAYELQWGSDKPGHIVFLMDLSGSMENKIDDVINAVQNTCKSIVARCMAGKDLRERVFVSVYGYNFEVKELLTTTPSSPKDLGKALKEAKSLNKPLFDKTKEAKPEYQTVMRLAFERAKSDIEQWISKQKAAGVRIPAPIVINITDGFPYEGKDKEQKQVFSETLKSAKDLTSIATPDGNVRLFNVHFDPDSKEETLRFPQNRPAEEHLQFLFDASSPMSGDMINLARTYFKEACMGSRCMLSNEKDISNLARFIDWGSSK